MRSTAAEAGARAPGGARRGVARGVAAVSLIGLLVAVSPDAAALPPDAHGWWYVLRSSSLPPEAQAPPPASVPPKGLYLSGGPGGAVAVSALRFTIPADEEVVSLVLAVADLQGTPSVGACPATSAWVAADGGPFDERPTADCEAGSALGVLDEAGTTLTFSLSGLVRDGALDVVLLPGKDEAGASDATFSLALEPPGPESLVTAPAGGDLGAEAPSGDGPAAPGPPGSSGSGAQAPQGTAPPPSPPGPSPAPSSVGFVAAPSFVPATGSAGPVPPPSSGVAATGAAVVAGQAPLPPAAVATQTVADVVRPDGARGRIAAAALAALAALAYATLRARPGLVLDGVEVDVGGIGRFARARTGTATRVS